MSEIHRKPDPMGRASGGPRGTRVRRAPFWCPWDNAGQGAWRFLAADVTHRTQLETIDPEMGDVVVSQPYYEAKGFVPLRDIPADDARRDLLPANWREVCQNHKVAPQPVTPKK